MGSACVKGLSKQAHTVTTSSGFKEKPVRQCRGSHEKPYPRTWRDVNSYKEPSEGGGKQDQIKSSKIRLVFEVGDVAQLVEYLPRKCEALGSIPSTLLTQEQWNSTLIPALGE